MKKLSKGRTLVEFFPLQPGETALLQACADGEFTELGHQRPSERTESNAVRASFIRFLALGGDNEAPVHEHGVQLAGAWIEGVLDLAGTFTPTGLSLGNSHFESSLVLRGAEIAGTLSLHGSQVPGLKADRLQCKGSVFMRNGFTATGEVRLLGAKIGGNLECNGAKLDGKDGDALSADRAVIKGSVFLSDGFTASGKVRLLGAQINGNLECNGAKLNGKEGDALSADGAVIKGDLFLSDGFTASGEVRLLGVQIGGNLARQGAKLDGKEGDSLSADGAVIKGGLFLSDGFSASGKVRLLGAQIGGNLECNGAKLDGKEGGALSADRSVIKGSVFLSDGFSASGKVRLLGAQIGGNLSCTKATLDGKEGNSLSADGMTVRGAFSFHSLAAPANGVSLSSAKVGRLIDDTDSWGERLVLNGFVYEHLAGRAPTDAPERLAWLDKQRPEHIRAQDFRPQPWKQLQKVLRAMGHAEDARQVAIAFEDRLRAAGLIGQTPAGWSIWKRTAYSCVAKGLHVLFKALIGYGYRPLRLGAWMLAVWLFCASVYWAAALQGVMAPSNPLVFQNMPQYKSCLPNWYLCETLPEEYTGFSPLAYSLDVLLPLVNLQQEQDWAPLITTPKGTWYQELFGNWSFKHLVRLVIWFEIIFGWVASLLLVAVVSGLTKRSED